MRYLLMRKRLKDLPQLDPTSPAAKTVLEVSERRQVGDAEALLSQPKGSVETGTEDPAKWKTTAAEKMRVYEFEGSAR